MTEEGRWRAYDYKDLVARDKASLDLFWLKDDSLEDSENLPEPDVLAQEIVEDLEAALVQFKSPPRLVEMTVSQSALSIDISSSSRVTPALFTSISIFFHSSGK